MEVGRGKLEDLAELKLNGEGHWRGRRVLVTGATGIIGSWLVKDLLAKGAEVVALIMDTDHRSELYRSGDIDSVSIVNGRLENFRTLERAIAQYATEVVFHLGAQTIVGMAQRSPLNTFESNIRGTYNLLEACRLNAGVVRRVVIASSDKAYGEQSKLPYTEGMPLEGKFPYEVSKSCADLISQAYHRAFGLPLAIARCGNVFGGGDLNWSRIVPGTIRSLFLSEPPVIRSDGKHLRDYIYVKDAARAYILLAERLEDDELKGRAYNFGTETPIPVTGMVQAIQRIMNCEGLEPIIQSNARGEIRNQYLSAKRARDELNWTPEFDLNQGLVETINWYRRFLSIAPK